ncbi:MAG: PIG-L family deacetylase, partial [Bacteroidales bacterium]|nr:PIG-L family deacetylase [Bacteroidales bacterium]
MKVAVVGATGLVGTKMMQVLEERNFPVTELIPVASERSAGKTVCFLICTDGRYGTDHAPASLAGEALASLRRKEAEASASLLGVRDLRFLDFSDGGFYEPKELQRAVAAAVSDFRPDVIFAPD